MKTIARALILTTLVVGSLVLLVTRGTDGGTGEPDPTATVTVPAGAPGWAEGVNPDWDFLAVIRTSGMDFSRNWEKDLASAGVELARVDTFELRAQVCGSAMDDGEGGYHQASKTHGLWLSSFYDHVRRMGRDHGWDTPKTVAYHHCPARFDAVNAVQALEARAKGH